MNFGPAIFPCRGASRSSGQYVPSSPIGLNYRGFDPDINLSDRRFNRGRRLLVSAAITLHGHDKSHYGLRPTSACAPHGRSQTNHHGAGKIRLVLARRSYADLSLRCAAGSWNAPPPASSPVQAENRRYRWSFSQSQPISVLNARIVLHTASPLCVRPVS